MENNEKNKQDKLYRRIQLFLMIGFLFIVVLCFWIFFMNSHVKKIDVHGDQIISQADTEKYYATRCEIIEQGNRYSFFRGYCYNKKEAQTIVEGYLIIQKDGVYYQMPTEALESKLLAKYYPEQKENSLAKHSGFISQFPSKYYTGQEQLYLTYRTSDDRLQLIPLTIGEN